MTKNELKFYSSLLQKKFRTEEKKFLVEGIKLIREAILSDFKCERIFFTSSFYEKYSDEIKYFEKLKIPFEQIHKKELEKLSDVKSPQEIIAVIHYKEKQQSNFNSKFIVALENINDPGNFGTIIRNCDWFGIDNIIASDDCAEIFSPKVIRASAGSVFHLNIFEEKEFCISLKNYKSMGYKLYCSDLDGKNISEIKSNSKIIIALSNEANGPTNELLKLSDEIITIPKKGRAESLNVANASAVILYEMTK